MIGGDGLSEEGPFEDDVSSDGCDEDMGLGSDSGWESGGGINGDDNSRREPMDLLDFIQDTRPQKQQQKRRSSAAAPPRKRRGCTLNHALRLLKRCRRSLVDDHRLREGSAAVDNIDVAFDIVSDYAEPEL